MHTDRWISSKYIIELPQVEFNPVEFLSVMQNYEFQHYVNAYGKATPQQVCYDPNVAKELIVQHYLNVFKDFDIRLDPPTDNHEHGTGLNGWSLIKSDMSENGLACHIDAKRPACITFPLTFPQTLNLHESKDSDILHTYAYKPVIIILNSGSKWHSVSKTPEPRWQFQLDCWNTWEEIHELVKTL